MRRIEVIEANHYELLKTLPDNHFDVVYFDPMFEETIEESNGIKGLTHFAANHDFTMEIINEAKRVARKRVVLKDHFRSSRFQRFGFDVLKTKNLQISLWLHFHFMNSFGLIIPFIKTHCTAFTAGISSAIIRTVQWVDLYGLNITD